MEQQKDEMISDYARRSVTFRMILLVAQCKVSSC